MNEQGTVEAVQPAQHCMCNEWVMHQNACGKNRQQQSEHSMTSLLLLAATA